MARTTIPKTTNLATYPALPLSAGSATLTLTAASGSSGSNGNQIAFGSGSNLVVIAQNTHASTAYTITVTSVADSFNRTGDITTYSLAAGDVVKLMLPRTGWIQADGNLYLEATNASVKFAAWEA